jgi:7-cyano-7-deazaguanine synthase in queuosine biosynthesis
MIVGKIDAITITDKDVELRSSFGLDYCSEQVRLALLTVVAGYLEKDDIVLPVTTKTDVDTAKLENFLSYMLNDERAAPRTYNIKLSLARSSSMSNGDGVDTGAKRIMSLSGGIDSVAGLLVALDNGENVVPVWVGFGQKNEERELETSREICKRLGLTLQEVHINIDKYIDHEWKRWKLGIIPGRNFLFAAIASQLLGVAGGTISICAHKEEITDANTDKSERFFFDSSAFLTQIAKKSVTVSTPFRNVTKPELIAYWDAHWASKFGISPQDTVSCYFGDNCGTCKACFNRALSFVVAGIPLENYLANPLTNERLLVDGYINRFDDLVEDRKADILYALSNYREVFSAPVKRFIDEQSNLYAQLIEKRRQLIRSGDGVKEAIYGGK